MLFPIIECPHCGSEFKATDHYLVITCPYCLEEITDEESSDEDSSDDNPLT